MNFTTPTHLNFLTKPVLKELTDSYNEILSIGCGIYGDELILEPGDNLQDGTGFWWNLQADPLSIISNIIDHVNGPLNSAKTDFLFFNETTFLAAANLVGGFRRARNLYTTGVNKGKPLWGTKGTIKHGDIIGPWIVEDIQKVLATIKWTMRNGTDIANVLQNPPYYGWVQTDYGSRDRAAWEAWMMPDYNAGRAWTTYGWGPDIEAPYSAEIGYYSYGFYDDWPNAKQGLIQRRRVRSKSAIKNIPIKITHMADLYNKLLDPANDPSKFIDLDGIGLTPNERVFIESFSSASEHERSTAYGDLLTDPADIVGITPFINEVIVGSGMKYSYSCYPMPFSVNTKLHVGMDVSNWLLKWNFTYDGYGA